METPGVPDRFRTVNAGAALVKAYLHLNGYLTALDFPVILGRRDGDYMEVTDLDVLAARFPGAAHVIPGSAPGPADDVTLSVDEVLAPAPDAVDVIVGEVKEGKPRLNDATRTDRVLHAALSRVGCVPADAMADAVAELKSHGEVRIEAGGGACGARVRLLAFGDGRTGARDGYGVISLAHVADFVTGYLDRHHAVLHPAELDDPVLGLLHLIRKLEPDEGA